jgi:signal transduction histidine kinase
MQDFSWAFVTWAVLGAMLTALYGRVHPWALVAFLGPTVLTRQMLLRSQALVDTSRAYRSREAAVREISRRIRDERSDERKLIAADLHDQVLQPLFKVSLVAQVLKADLAGGKLLELDQDLPELLTASDLASVTLRELIGDLRRSALGRGGLGPALTRFVDSLRGNTPRITSRISDVRATADQELALYQIAREALWNSIKHARATAIHVELHDSEDHIVLAVDDNGIGFDPLEESPGHFGIHILRERAQGVGAHLMLDTSPGMGCRISVHVPRADHD